MKFNGNINNYKFDDEENFGGSNDTSYLQRLQTWLDGTKARSVSYEMTFYLVDEQGARKQVSLENFWVNPVDIDSFEDLKNDSAEFFEISNIGIAQKGGPGSSEAGVIYELPEPDE